MAIWVARGGRVIGQELPAGRRRYVEYVLAQVLVLVFRVGVWIGFRLFLERLEAIGDVFEKDQAQYNVLVLGGIHIVAQFVGGSSQGFFKVFDVGHSVLLGIGWLW